MRRIIPCILSCLLGVTLQLSAQQDILKFDKTVHDFGQVLLGSGPISCSFTATNVSSTSQCIQSVSTSCGCTAVKWDHKEIAPGGKTVITATYTNDEGAYPFDKTLTVTLTSGRRPVVLHLRGVCRKEFKPDEVVYTFSLGGGLGLMEGSLKAVNVVLIGVMATSTDIPYENWIATIRSTVPPKFVELNVKAFDLGYHLK